MNYNIDISSQIGPILIGSIAEGFVLLIL